jgi:hypothetical protein
MAFASHRPGSQHLLLHAAGEANPARDNAAEWTEPQLAKRCAELCGKPCLRQVAGITLRNKLLRKGLVTSRKASHKLLLWALTAEARAAALFRVS